MTAEALEGENKFELAQCKKVSFRYNAQRASKTNHNNTRGIVMAEDTLADRGNSINQSSLSSSRSHEAYQSSERIAKLEFIAMLLAKADALSSVALRDAFAEASPS